MSSKIKKIFSSIWILTGMITGAPKQGMHKAFICTHFVPKFQLRPRPAVFGFLLGNCRFYPVFGYQMKIMRYKITKIGLHVAYSHARNKTRFFRLNRILVITKSINLILIYENGQKITKVLSARSPNYFQRFNFVCFRVL